VVVYSSWSGRYLLAGWYFGRACLHRYPGWVGRSRYGGDTQVGAYLDPIADKVPAQRGLPGTSLGSLVPWWLVAIIFGRDIYILAAVGVFMLWTPVRQFPPSIWGKVSTFVQICTAILWIAHTIFGTRVLGEISSAMLWPCVAFTVWSAVDYTWKGIRTYRKY